MSKNNKKIISNNSEVKNKVFRVRIRQIDKCLIQIIIKN